MALTGEDDFAHQMRALVDRRYPDAELIRVVLANLNTHSPAALYETFAPAEARPIARKLEFHYTPVHGSWLNMARLEFLMLARQCLNRRIPDREDLAPEVAAWETARTEQRVTIRCSPPSRTPGSSSSGSTRPDENRQVLVGEAEFGGDGRRLG